MNVPETIDAATSVEASDNVYARRFGDELILLHFGRGEYYGLDPVGACIWERCAAGETLGDIAREVVRSFDVDYRQALADVVALVGELRTAGLVKER
ncbi:MAG: PqqD family protein [Labilithrix sp.]|nr:PqqD family protein [Labilithrix sp.]MCW5813498.1 PqqD family protein [Labilithrix sp.]